MNDVNPNWTVGGFALIDGEVHYRIANSHEMPEFFMSLVGSSDHWMFVSSRGALTAGRRNADQALFPYAADDQISAARDSTGVVTRVRMTRGSDSDVWEPFAVRAGPHVRRNLYKTPLGSRLIFEEIDDERALGFRYRWAFSDQFGFVRSCRLENRGSTTRSVEVLDGLRNLLPYGLDRDFQMRFSNLGNAYKKSEIEAGRLGLFYLSSVPTDRAEPCEGLRATTAWLAGPEPRSLHLRADAVERFSAGSTLESDVEVRGQPGAFLAVRSFDLDPGTVVEWQVVADVARDHNRVVALVEWLQTSDDPSAEIVADIARGETELLRIVTAADGVQLTANRQRCHRHLANCTFNVMRGGVPLDGYDVETADFHRHVGRCNRRTQERHHRLLASLPEHLSVDELRARTAETADPDLERLGLEYMPLAFSRRHGDPTRPWNQFSIDLRGDDGRINLNYQGNWRDIFQNWEALLMSFPRFASSMICRFVNATTADGYNPYRLTQAGFEWEEPAPEEPWANIGYWGDHQIIYLLKLLEWAQRFDPEGLDALMDKETFTHAAVPYRIRSYPALRADPRATIDFDSAAAEAIDDRVAAVGADGKLLRDADGGVLHVSLVEKLLTLSLAKMANFVPDGGIWMNTQRPEWNDANNALVGNGLSVVTAGYLHRWFGFLCNWLNSQPRSSFAISSEVAACLADIAAALQSHAPTAGVGAAQRRGLLDDLATPASSFRENLYAAGFSGQTTTVPTTECVDFFAAARAHLAATIRSNRREDGLYHAYNLLDWRDDGIVLERLNEMLEGQVAVASAGVLEPRESVELLDALRSSALYRADQDSYMLYPNRTLPRFLEKNRIDPAALQENPLLLRLLEAGDRSIVRRDVKGECHFQADLQNANDLRAALAALGSDYAAGVATHGPATVRLYEDTFGHRRFTGRSGSFFAYEGLGSIYWHMVSKLGLAVAENFFAALEGDAGDDAAALARHYRAIQRGIGAEKSPQRYGAFPTDPYSHTPEGAGVKQPGMTGQVKEDILARHAELGVHIEDGCVEFRPSLFDTSELLTEPGEMCFFDLEGERRSVPVPADAYAFTFCQVPIVCRPGAANGIELVAKDGTSRHITGSRLDRDTSRQLFARTGEIEMIRCELTELR